MKTLYKLIGFIAVLVLTISCRKTETVEADLSKFNPDNPTTNTALDQWLKSTFLDPYNIEVIYRYNRYYHGNTANVVPSNLNNIQPTMQIVLDGFISPYLKVAGSNFTKTYMPKEWVLFGSYSYADSNDPGVAGTAAAGRRITLYGLNDYQPLPAGQFYAWDRHRIMHHEFGHILNQIIPIPTDWEGISKGLYKQPYKDTPIATAHANGFVTSYASGQPTEDYAETISWALINGQAWYDYWANTSSAEGKNRLIQKELNVINYYKSLGINFKDLQKEVQLYMKNTLNLNESRFSYWLGQKLYSSMMINLDEDVYKTFGISSDFTAVYEGVRMGVAAAGNANRRLNYIRLDFPTATTMVVNVNYTNTAGSVLDAKYAINVAINQTTGEVKFTNGTAGGTDATWAANASAIKPGVQIYLDYLINNTFVADWLPANINGDNYMKYAGFYLKGNPDSYFYGQLAY
ncbi:substrate import-associated zinc metallohydrolase lipoprotein [Pedobacter nototheniae]|uniref:substrate import-associated zinc metallohydrolase lipoprotein n=1 Tax=Pedobacter nototheniae TaxID=2488994 RepID=UPI001040AB69|nr:substrate import-associated zinc metallohydrolase lipoprotein [Pedobacter nototheniae]